MQICLVKDRNFVYKVAEFTDKFSVKYKVKRFRVRQKEQIYVHLQTYDDANTLCLQFLRK